MYTDKGKCASSMTSPAIGPNGPIVHQPQLMQNTAKLNCMNAPSDSQNWPLGLEVLESNTHLFVKQKTDMLEAICGCSSNNIYQVLNNNGMKIFWAAEESNCCSRNCLSSERPFEIELLDLNNYPMMTFRRPFSCFLDSVYVAAPPGHNIGTVDRLWSCKPIFAVKNAQNETLYRIKGPMCTVACCSDVDFVILNTKDEEVGRISKHWTSLRKEFFTSADTYGIHFPAGCDIHTKALLLGACFLIDFKYFEPSE